MNDATRPLAVGYIRAHILMTEHELEDAKKNLAAFAQAEGYALGEVFVENLETLPNAFYALVEMVKRDEAKAVVVPGLHHLAVVGDPGWMREHLQQGTGVLVLSARHSP